MSYYYLIPTSEHETIKRLYKEGFSCQEIVNTLKLRVTARSMQRFIHKQNLSRTVGDAFRNAMARGRVRFVKKELSMRTKRTKLRPSLRFKILQRDGYRCVLCGATAKTTLLEVDHINSTPTDHREENLQTLCYECNMGKPSPNRKGTMSSGVV